ncbi:hypothetical protein [Natranaerofaba carboxydovora]|uniref:hypothetical protein n=1 Tax=Natranaerofaba carboxydovora TaxID=2742683 RepID=UPI001F13E513|nr:hypothetical protein [Natranaerofaba carboxydovora]UMZ74909.1 hypothetical protein ACONDI_02513 [Natranaerofaba carboxydovora]
MNYNFYKNLFRKEIKMFKGKFPSLTSNYKYALGLFLLMALGMAGLILTFYSLFNIYLTEISPVDENESAHLVTRILLIWVTIIIFFSSVQDSKDKFFNEEFNFLLSTPIRPWFLFLLRLLKSSYLSMANNFLLLFFGIGPLIGLGILYSTPWYNYLAIIIVSYLYMIVPVAIGIVTVMLIVRIVSIKWIFHAAMLLNFLLIVLWLFFMSMGQEVILSELVHWIANYEGYIDLIFFLAITGDIIRDLVLQDPIDTFRLTVLFFPMLLVTLLTGSLIVKSAYQVSYEKVRLSAKKKALPTVKISWLRLFKRKISPFRRFLLLMITQYKLVMRNQINILHSMVYFSLVLLFLLVLLVLEIREKSYLIFSVIFLVLLVNLGVRAFFKPAVNYFGYFILSPLKNSFIIWNLWISRFILQFLIGGIVVFLLWVNLDLGPMIFVNLFVFMTLLFASIESLLFLLNIMEYSNKFSSMVYYSYYIIVITLGFFLSQYGYEVSVWALNITSMVVFVLSMHFSETKWDDLEIDKERRAF